MLYWELTKEDLVSRRKRQALKVRRRFAFFPVIAENHKRVFFKSYFLVSYRFFDFALNINDTIYKKLTLEQMDEIERLATGAETPKPESEQPAQKEGPDQNDKGSWFFPKTALREEKAEETKKDFLKIKENLLKKIYGQDEIIEGLMKKVMRKEFSLSTDAKKPLSLFWAGPTGVGKTETALQLAKNLEYQFVRLDMSEYMHDHNVSRLIGSPPGYVGFSQPGVLAGYHNCPCIILIDEIEKAHPDVYHIFLQILDYGTLTDGRNQKMDFSKAIVIMTSNVGARELSARKPSLIQTSDFSIESKLDRITLVKAAMDRVFAPEFINRLSLVQVFNSLDEETICRIVDGKIKDVLEAIKEKYSVEVVLKAETREKIYKDSYDVLMGARPVLRALEKHLLEPVCEKIFLEEDVQIIEL